MLMVLSPAKAMNFEGAPDAPLTTPELKADIAELAERTVKLRAGDLKKMMGISDALADLNRARFQAFDPVCEDGVQAIFAFNGDVYQGLQARTLNRTGLDYAQKHIRILSGLYGVLRPLDAIQPYRLEMDVALKTRRSRTLYGFWGATIARALDAVMEPHRFKTIVNLASQEYFAAVDRKALATPVVNVHFKEEKDGDLRVLSFYAKRARGLCARYAIDHRLKSPEELMAFDIDGYRFRRELSTDTDWVFARPQPPLKTAPRV